MFSKCDSPPGKKDKGKKNKKKWTEGLHTGIKLPPCSLSGTKSIQRGLERLHINHTSENSTLTIIGDIVSLGRKKVSLDEWSQGSSCSFWLWLMRCLTVLRLIQATETYGHLWSISMFGSYASLTSHSALELERSAWSLGYGREAIRSMQALMQRWGCWAVGERLFSAGNLFPLVTLFQFHSKLLINRYSRTWTRIEGSISPHIISW